MVPKVSQKLGTVLGTVLFLTKMSKSNHVTKIVPESDWRVLPEVTEGLFHLTGKRLRNDTDCHTLFAQTNFSHLGLERYLVGF